MLADQGGMDLKGILSCVSKEDYIRWAIQRIERCRMKMRLGQGSRDGDRDEIASRFVLIFELSGWSFSDVFSKSVMELGLALTQMQEANYPEHLKRVYILNGPWFFTMVLGVLRPFLGQATLDKVVCLGSKERHALTRAISREVLPRFWGGDRVDEDGDPKCSSLIGKGGKVPKSLYRTGKNAKEEPEEEREDREPEEEEPRTTIGMLFRCRTRERERVDGSQEDVSGEILLQESGLKLPIPFVQLQERLQDVTIPEGIRHEVFLLKFLKARDYDLDKTEKMFRAVDEVLHLRIDPRHSKQRVDPKEIGLNGITRTSIFVKHLEWREKWRPEYLRDEWKVPEVLQIYATNGFLGFDFEGSPGGMDLEGILSCVSKEDYIRWAIRKLEQCRQKMRMDPADESGNEGRTQFVNVCELQGWSFSKIFSKSVLDLSSIMAEMQEANYPEHLKRTYVLNVPWYFTMAMNIIKPFLRRATLDKFVFLGGKDQYVPVLTQVIPKEILPKFWGGTRVDEDGDPKCPSVIGKGGKVPESLYRKNKNAKEEKEKEQEEEESGGGDEGVKTLRGGEALNLECRASRPGSLLSWKFSTEMDGVEYSVLRLEDGEEAGSHLETGRSVRERERVDSHREDVSGEILLQEPGLYCLRFQSERTSDRLSYAIVVIPPLDPL
ncbi:unnamed protein product [Darwinula stevensoni]|uniref:CRAL-TRIO domain-containing protein n=1 Tax=Darwinula stevensoni TaxID=69355 RepID=A0A7R9AB44_9CRUS|nr:unnamed protein product [Darwinula stevensoni]CAG0898931.1 unnamed protein product [Darwinula stevensoni]